MREEDLIEEARQIQRDGYADAQCWACEEFTRIEPDAWRAVCPHCGEPTLTSPLVELQLI